MLARRGHAHAGLRPGKITEALLLRPRPTTPETSS